MRLGFRRLVVVVASLALIVGAGVSSPAWADPAEEKTEEISRPDWVSATVSARALGERVEVLSEKSETGRTWVHPDGSVEEEQASAPVRFLDDVSQGWREIDTTLRVTAEGVEPVSMPVGVVLGHFKGAAVNAIGFIPGAQLGAKILRSAGKIGKYSRTFLSWQANNKYLGTASKLFRKDLNIKGIRIGWGQGPTAKPMKVAWRLGLRGQGNKAFVQVSSVSWLKRKK